ncbi:MAG TPA: VWA domain-containing protein [Bryobacteraceae bacterium]|nr:VWA domain-containing protein [Bryobacteraceae bacterium]
MVCLVAIGLSAQAQPPTVIRTQARLVLVDATVRDKKGKLVTTLTKDDFRLWEDGKERPISGLSTEAASDAPQYVLFLFDGTVEKDLRQDVSDLAGAYADPHRYMAVVNLHGGLSISQNFTSMPERIQRAAMDAPPSSPAPVDRTAALVNASNMGGRGGGSINPLNNPLNAAQSAAAAVMMDALRDLADGLAAIKGRKLVVVVGGYAGTDYASESTVKALNRADVSVYATNPGLKSVGEATGGGLIKGDLTKGVGDLLDNVAKSYLLSFTPADSPTGSCHSLRVRTVASGLQITARDGYCNTEAPDVLAGKIEGKALEAHIADSTAGAAASIELPYFYDSPGVALVDLSMEMDLATLKFTKQNGKEHADLDLVGLAYAEDGSVAARFSDSLPLDFEAAQVVALHTQPYHYERQFRLPPGKYTVRVAFGSGGQSIGKAEAPLAIDAWDGSGVTLGGIALASETKQVEGLAADLDPALLEGRKDLIAGSVQIAPSGDNRFRASEPYFAYLEIYNSSGKWDLTLRVLDRATGAERAAMRSAAQPGAHPAAVQPLILKLNGQPPLPPGDYILEIAMPGSNAVKRAEFHITP